MRIRGLAVASILSLLAISLALAACGDDDDEDEPTNTPAATTPAESTPTPVPFNGGRDPVEVPWTGTEPPVCTLVDVQAEAHEGYDRVTFYYQDCIPGYRVLYVDEAVECGSGETEEVAGAALLEVTTNPAMAHNDQGETTVPALELTPGLDGVLELDSTCDFEGYVTWVLGLSAEADFRVLTGEGDLTLVVDVQTP